MSSVLSERPVRASTPNGGGPARRAVIRWAWRLLRREWRQQLLVLALIMVAVAATLIGAAVAADTPPPASTGFGTATDLATFQPPGPRLASQIAALRHRFGRADVIENQTVAIPGLSDTYDLRAQDPRGPFGQPMLALLAGHYPAGPGQVAMTSGLASDFNLKIGDTWRPGGGQARQVTGIVQNPQDLVTQFALVVPGQVRTPTRVTVLFDAPGVAPRAIGPAVQTPESASSGNPLNPETIVLALDTIGMLLIALVGVAGFTVLAQRRLRAIGMLGALGATDRHIRLAVRANGVLAGVAGALTGAAVGLAGWLAYRPHLEASAHHAVGAFQLPWIVIGPAMALAVVAAYVAASRPARAVSRVPIVTALSGRPAPPRQAHRSALPGVVALVIAGVLLWFTGSRPGGGGGPELVLGLVALVVAVILLSPLCLEVLARLGRRAPIGVRLAVRDLARYRARSSSALAAIGLSVLIAVMICVLSAQRFGNVLDYAGPNLASNQLLVMTANGPGGPDNRPGATASSSQPRSMAATARGIAAALGSHHMIELDTTSATLQHAAAGRQFSGQVYVATPQLLRAFGIRASQVDPAADILTTRPGLPGIAGMQLVYGSYFGAPGKGRAVTSFPCPKTDCLASPVIQEVSGLPPGTSAPNTVITEHAISELGLHPATAGWLIQAPHPPTAAQINSARLRAAASGLTIQTRSSIPSSAEIINWATVFGIALALGILAMSVGLIRSEAASDLRTLTASGASSVTRRALTAVTAGSLGLLGALLGTVAAYAGIIAYASQNQLDGLCELSHVPVMNLLIIVAGMPLTATAAGWLLAGREPSALARQPIE